VGQRLDRPWVREALALQSTESYCVSAFEPSDLYEGRNTYVYCAAIRATGRASRVVGGIAIVFDGEPQFTAMLTESLPRDERGNRKAGAFGVFIDGAGRVIASSLPEITLGTRMACTDDARRNGQASWERVLTFEGSLYAVGACRSSGYREYKGDGDPYRNDVTSLFFAPLASAADSGDKSLRLTRPERAAPRHVAGVDTVDLASFIVGDKWYAVQAARVVEAMRPGMIALIPGAPQHIRGCVMVQDSVLLVVDLPSLLDTRSQGRRSVDAQFIVIVREAPQSAPFGLLVDELGDTFEIARSRLVSTQLAQSENVLVESVVTPDASAPHEPLLLMLATDRLAACGRGVGLEQLSALVNPLDRAG
jgi:chemotaxis signal transduction protein